MKPYRVSILQSRGTPFELGRAQARSFATTPKGRAFLRRKINLPPWFDLRVEEKAYVKFAPALWQEIAGLADGLGIPMASAAFCFGNGGMRFPTGGCSAVMANGVYGRNYDYRPR